MISLITMRVLIRVCLPLLLLVTQPGRSNACSPPASMLDAGFYRQNVGHLPRNARGVVFFPPSKKPKVSDFKITSPDDKRPLALRVHVLRNGDTIRLEPIGGFAPNMHYEFKYLSAHDRWRYPDHMSVAIDDAIVDTAGTYTVELAPQPEVRMIVVPGSPACVEPVVAVTQPFSYRTPAALAPYRAALVYGTDVRPEPLREPNKKKIEFLGWPIQLASYYATIYWPYGQEADEHYTGADDVIVASCDRRRLRGDMSGRVSFPELDDKVYRVAHVRVDLSRNVLGQCRPLDALTRTMQVYGPKKALKTVCGRIHHFDDDQKQTDVAARTDAWEWAFGFLYELSPTCELVTLADALSTRQYLPDRKAMGRLGTALEEGLLGAERMWSANGKPAEEEPEYLQSIDALGYLMRELPKDLQPNASAMLVPLLPRLVTHLAEPKVYRPDVVAALIVRAGSLPTSMRVQIMSIAEGRTAGASHARAILAAQPGAARVQPLKP